MIKYQKIFSMPWSLLVNRRQPPLFLSNTFASYTGRERVTGILSQPEAILQLGDGRYFIDARFIRAVRQHFHKGGLPVLRKFQRELVRHVQTFDEYAQALSQVQASEMHETTLEKTLARFFDLAANAQAFLDPVPIADGVLTEKIHDLLPSRDEATRRQWLTRLMCPAKENFHTQEERSLLHLALAYRQRPSHYPKMLRQHVKRFAWIGGRWYWWQNAWTEQDIQRRVQEMLKVKNPVTALRQFEAALSVQKRQSVFLERRLLKTSSKRLHTVLVEAREFAYLRIWRTDVMYRAGYLARHIFYEAAKRAGIPQRDIVYCTRTEILNLVQRKKVVITQAELDRRRRYCALLLLKKKSFILSGSAWKKKFAHFMNERKTPKILKGQVAYSGRVVGRVKVVLDTKDLRKVRSGDVLVAVMTFPHFIAAMEKAAAFVTDEGGILCHAAIVSREMRKPCVIGTKHATRLLQDGDVVEVDGNSGIVKIL